MILPTRISPPTSSGSRCHERARPKSSPSSSMSSMSSKSPVRPTINANKQRPITKQRNNNRLFLTFAFLSFVVAIINIQFHHLFHEEHVLEKSHRKFQGFFKTSRKEESESESQSQLLDDYVLRRTTIDDEGEEEEEEEEEEEGGDHHRNDGNNNNNSDSDGTQQQQQQQHDEGGGHKGLHGNGHKLAGLQCEEKYGGPKDEYAEREMAFWSDIPSDASYRSPFMDEKEERFLTFEPDHGGWNNIRMAMETALVMSHAMGRTLVLPPEQRFYLLGKGDQKQKQDFDFGDFFHLDSIAVEHEGFNVISSEEFLHRYGKAGRLNNAATGETELWSEKARHTADSVRGYLRKVGVNPRWNPMECIAAFPSEGGADAADELRRIYDDIIVISDGGKEEDGSSSSGSKRHHRRPKPKLEDFEGNPVPVDAPAEERMRELLADRDRLCIYDEQLQRAPVLHFPAEKGTRLLTHFYAFIFFADWKADLWSKRFVRDHLRYIDEIMCAAARVVEALRKRSKNKDGLFDSMHVRRGDFQYKKTRLEAKELIKKSKDKLEEGGLLFIATDERDKSFFAPFKEHYEVVFLDDFKHLLKGINTNYYGMLDQLVASKGRVFVGTWWSTLSGYVNRMRGYYIAKHKLDGYQDGTMESYYFYPDERQNQMKQYMPVKKPIYMREFPTSWRDLDKGIQEIHQS